MGEKKIIHHGTDHGCEEISISDIALQLLQLALVYCNIEAPFHELGLGLFDCLAELEPDTAATLELQRERRLLATKMGGSHDGDRYLLNALLVVEGLEGFLCARALGGAVGGDLRG